MYNLSFFCDDILSMKVWCLTLKLCIVPGTDIRTLHRIVNMLYDYMESTAIFVMWQHSRFVRVRCLGFFVCVVIFADIAMNTAGSSCVIIVFLCSNLLLARLMGQYCFARWHLWSVGVCRLSSSVTLPAGGRAADTPRRASHVTSR